MNDLHTQFKKYEEQLKFKETELKFVKKERDDLILNKARMEIEIKEMQKSNVKDIKILSKTARYNSG